MNNLGVYIHIPFCVKKCNYCDFNSGPFSKEIQLKYVESLCKEMINKSQFFSCYNVDTVFIGGGTPSILDADLIGKIFDTLNKNYCVSKDAEMTIECNPGTTDEEKLKKYLSFGINRISFGLQSTDNEQLAILGRIHKYEDFLKSFNDARSAGFKNINVDLMSAIPNQDLKSFTEGLLKVKELSPEHISIYSLIIEECTPFYNMNLNLANEDEEREMVHVIPSVLGEEYHQYEISNYAKKGFECKHNIKYWKRDEYVGFGVSAASLLQTDICNDNSFDCKNSGEGFDFSKNPRIRLKNISNVEEYIGYEDDINKINGEKEILEPTDIESEYIFLGLRMNDGIEISDYSERFHKNIFEEYDNSVNKHIENGLLLFENGRLFLSEKGRDLSNYVFKDFV